MKKRILCLFFAVLLLFSIIPLSVFADETTTDGSEGELESMDLSKTSIKYDFEYVFFNAFKLDDYKPNAAKGNIELITMTEVLAEGGYIDLYLYVYNPSQKTVFDNEADMVTMSTYQGQGKFEKYNKYQLERVQVEYATKNTQLETNASIIKYKVTGYSERSMEIERSYGISEIELSLKSGLQSFTVGKTFTFTDSEDGMLSVSYGTFDVMELGVGHTYYRLLVNNRISAEDYKDIRSVYFAVNRDSVKNAGVLDSVDIYFQEYITKPILLIDDQDICNEFANYIGQSFPSDFEYSFGSDISANYNVPYLSQFSPLLILKQLQKGICGFHQTNFNYVINPSELPSKFVRGDRSFVENLMTVVDASISMYSLNHNGGYNLYENEIEKLYWLFACESFGAVSGESIIEYANEYSGTGQVWSEELFDEIKEPQKLTITRKDIQNSVNYSYVQNGITEWLSRYYGNLRLLKNEGNLKFNMLEEFKTSDLDLENIEISEKYLIDVNDVDNFTEFVRGNADSYIYILRYAITDTTLEEGSLFTDDFIDVNALPAILTGFTGKCYACTSSLAQTTLINDFDIITLTYVNELGEYTVFPVGITPTDHSPDLNHPNKPDSAEDLDKKFEEFMKMLEKLIKIIVIIAVIALIVYAFFVFSPYISAFFSRIGLGGGSNVSTNVNVNLSDEVEKKKNEVKKDEEKTD